MAPADPPASPRSGRSGRSGGESGAEESIPRFPGGPVESVPTTGESVRSDVAGRKTFDELFIELSGKWQGRAAGSGTVAALDQGVHHLGKKLVEEAAEAWMAAEYEGRERAAEEISQLLYWSQLLMISLGLSLDDVYSHL